MRLSPSTLLTLPSALVVALALPSFLALFPSAATCADWAQFRGPGSAGKTDADDLPVRWSSDEGIAWKRALPGPGASSPIVVGDKIIVTAYSGYGTDADAPGQQQNLVLHVLCYAAKDGSPVWSRKVSPSVPDEDYEQWLPEHGYASATPCSDGEIVVAFFGKSGVHAFDLDSGSPKWDADVGDGTHGFGTAGSPILHGDLVFVNASVESGKLFAFDKKTGKEVWARPGIDRAWSAPVIVRASSGREELVISAQDALIAFEPKSGEELWRVKGIDDYVCPSVIAHDGIVYAMGGRKNIKSLAVRAGGDGDVEDSHVLWKSKDGSKVPSPVFHEGHLYLVTHDGFAQVQDAKTGEVVQKKRLDGPSNSKTYASFLFADDKLWVPTWTGGVVVFAATPDLEQLAHNTLDDDSIFNASPVPVGDDRMLLRSNRYLWCLGE